LNHRDISVLVSPSLFVLFAALVLGSKIDAKYYCIYMEHCLKHSFQRQALFLGSKTFPRISCQSVWQRGGAADKTLPVTASSCSASKHPVHPTPPVKSRLVQRLRRWGPSSRGGPVHAGNKISVDNRELLTGDCLLLISFCLYKQITAIILQPSFPGWLEPLHFNPVRFGELASFGTTLTVTWVLSSLLVGGYRNNATADLATALSKVSQIWLISMPVAACQLLLLTAAEDRQLLEVLPSGADLFASALPLAASGPGEPFATAAGVLGIMAIWRCVYAVFLDYVNARQWGSFNGGLDRIQDFDFFVDALRSVFFLTIGCVIVIQFLAKHVGEEALQGFLVSAASLLP